MRPDEIRSRHQSTVAVRPARRSDFGRQPVTALNKLASAMSLRTSDLAGRARSSLVRVGLLEPVRERTSSMVSAIVTPVPVPEL